MKFSIRDMLLVTVITALAVGWWVDRSRLATQHAEKDNALKAYGMLTQYLSDNLSESIDAEITTRQPVADGREIVVTSERKKRAAPLPTSSAPAPNPPKK